MHSPIYSLDNTQYVVEEDEYCRLSEACLPIQIQIFFLREDKAQHLLYGGGTKHTHTRKVK
jgi:hypothetical protein